MAFNLNIKFNFVSLFIILLIIIPVIAIKCWQCNSNSDPKCADPFDNMTLPMYDCAQTSYSNPLINNNVKPSSCRKVRQKVNGKWTTIRGCALLGEAGEGTGNENNCLIKRGTDDIFVEYCTCNSKHGYRKNSQTDQLNNQITTNKRFSNLSANSLTSKQSFLNIEVIREGYNVDLKRVDNTFTKLHRACLLNYDEKKLMKYIKKYDINQIDNVCQSTPLHLCIVNGNLNYLNILIKNGGDINLRDGIGKTLLIKAIELQNEQIIQYLIQNQVDVNRTDNTEYKNSPLHWSILTGYFKGISLLLNCTHINVNQVNSNQETALHLIAKSSKNLYVFIDDCLDNNGINLDKQDSKGRTALFIACSVGNYHCVEILLKNNANPTINNLLGESPLQVAKSKGFVDIVDLFENNNTNQFIKELKSKQPNNSLMTSKPINSNQINNQNDNQNDNKRNSIFSVNSADFMKTVTNNDDDSWPETLSNTSINDNKKLNINLNYNHLSVNNNKTNDDSFNSFKMNTNIKSDSSSISDNILKKKDNLDQSSNQLNIVNQNSSLIKINTREEEQQNSKLKVLHPENDEFIKQMKSLIEEEMQLNEELDEMLIIKQPELENSKKINNQLNNHIINYLSDDDWDNENDTLIKKPNINIMNNENQIHSLRKQSLIYGLSDEEDDQKQISNRNISSDEESIKQNQLNNVKSADQDQINSINNQLINSSKPQLLTKKESRLTIVSDSSLSDIKSIKEDEELINRFDSLMIKINEYDKQNQRLSIELDEALAREKELKKVNNTLNQQYEDQNQQLILLETRLKQSEQNYKLIKEESEQFKNEFRNERLKFENEFIKFIEEEHKQKEQQLMKLIDDKQDMCNKLTDELNYLKDKYVNKDEIEFINDDLIKRLENNQLFNNLIKQNEKINHNFKQLQTSLDEHQLLTESVKKLNSILYNLEEQLKQQTKQFNNKLNDQHNDLSQFMETNVQNIQNQFRTEIELKLSEVKSIVEELKNELIEFINNYKLPKHNEEEITNLINQILSKSIKEYENVKIDLINQQLDRQINQQALNNKIDEEFKNDKEFISKDDEKTSLEFDADDVFDDKRSPENEKEFEIKKTKKQKIKLNKLIWEDKKSNKLINQYSDAILNSINQLKNDDYEIYLNDDYEQQNKKNLFQKDYSKQLNLNQLNYMQQLNRSNQKQYQTTKLRSQSDKLQNVNLDQLDTMKNFEKRRIILEKDIINLKLQLGLYTTTKLQRSNSNWNL